MTEQITTKDVGDLAYEYYSGNQAAGTLLAMQETLFALGIPESETANRLINMPFSEGFIKGVAIAPISEDHKVSIFKDTSHLLDHAPHLYSGRRIILRNIGRLVSLNYTKSLFENEGYLDGYQMLCELQSRCRKEIPRPSLQARHRKFARNVFQHASEMTHMTERVQKIFLYIDSLETERNFANNPLQTP